MIRTINTLDDFTKYVKEPFNAGLVREIFTNQCSPELKQEIYNLADPGSDDPLANSMKKLGIEL